MRSSLRLFVGGQQQPSLGLLRSAAHFQLRSLATASTGMKFKRETPENFYLCYGRGMLPCLVDLREPDDHRKENIIGSHSLPLSKLSKEFIEEKLHGISRVEPLFLHHSGGDRAAPAAPHFAGCGFQDVRILEGGVLEISRDAGFTIARDAEFAALLQKRQEEEEAKKKAAAAAAGAPPPKK
ncbi:hypothetical protein QOT17_005729 [Balamuthia mandrillaris]